MRKCLEKQEIQSNNDRRDQYSYVRDNSMLMSRRDVYRRGKYTLLNTTVIIDQKPAYAHKPVKKTTELLEHRVMHGVVQEFFSHQQEQNPSDYCVDLHHNIR